ncbi:hypothetical protein [Calothrix sp. CCY 0018]|uniref:hypothetical protein n=1 Tax=Calothrix sp. CCY 0018 TaxID=3103864 RepID=UPI0039C6DCB8
MALIEYLERDDWREALRRNFEGAIALLQTDRFGRCSSAVDDMKSWLALGGVSRVQLQLDRQMEGRRLAVERQREIRDFLEQLVLENQSPLLQLIDDGIIPWNQADFLVTMGISEAQFDAMWEHISASGNFFETWMLANGYSQDRINQIYQIIDRWLVKAGLNLDTHPEEPTWN